MLQRLFIKAALCGSLFGLLFTKLINDLCALRLCGENNFIWIMLLHQPAFS